MFEFFRRWFAGRPGSRTSTGGSQSFLDLECDRCGEQFHLYIDRATQCLQVFDEPGVAWRLEREVVGARCRTVIQVRIDFAPGGEIVQRQITHGRFLSPSAEG